MVVVVVVVEVKVLDTRTGAQCRLDRGDVRAIAPFRSV